MTQSPQPNPTQLGVERAPGLVLARAPLPSLRARLLRHVFVPLALVWLVGTAITAAVAYYYAEQAFDRALLDDAYALAANVKPDASASGALELRLTPSELNALLFDQTETVYFAVLRADGGLIGGHAWLGTAMRSGPTLPDTVPAQDPDKGYEFADVSHQGKPLRAVSLQRIDGGGFRVLMAQTVNSRSALLRRVLLFSFIPQGLLLVLLGAWLRRAIGADLRPLTELHLALDQRDAGDLTPVAVEAATRDVQVLSRSVNALLTRVDAGLRAQREFAGNVAHELRTPLAGIRVLADYGLQHSEPAIWRQQLQAVADSEIRASHMVEQLLALALADETRDNLRLIPLRLDLLVRRLLLQAMPRADVLGVDLGARNLDEPITIEGDEGLIEGALNNLLDNALRYGKPGNATAQTITVEMRRTSRTVSLLVIDNGPGMAADAQQNMMKRWRRDPAVNAGDVAHSGGLGLAIVSRYADLLGAKFHLGAISADQTTLPGGFCAGLTWVLKVSDNNGNTSESGKS